MNRVSDNVFFIFGSVAVLCGSILVGLAMYFAQGPEGAKMHYTFDKPQYKMSQEFDK